MTEETPEEAANRKPRKARCFDGKKEHTRIWVGTCVPGVDVSPARSRVYTPHLWELQAENQGVVNLLWDAGVSLASYTAAPKRDVEVARDVFEDQDNWVHWFNGLWLRVYDVLNRPEIWLLLITLGYFIQQVVASARDIIHTQMMKERQQHRQQILQRYGVQEDEQAEGVKSNASSSDEEEEVAADPRGSEDLGSEDEQPVGSVSRGSGLKEKKKTRVGLFFP